MESEGGGMGLAEATAPGGPVSKKRWQAEKPIGSGTRLNRPKCVSRRTLFKPKEDAAAIRKEETPPIICVLAEASGDLEKVTKTGGKERRDNRAHD